MKKFHKLKLLCLVSLLTFALVFIGFHLLQAQGKPDKPPGKAKKEKPSPPLELGVINLATQDSEALRVWTRPYAYGENVGTTEFVEQWSKENCYCNSLEFGDANNDGVSDLVVSRYIEKRKKNQVEYYSYFEVYEDGSTGESSFTSEKIPSGKWYWENEALVADLDGDDANEVILKTSRMIAIYRLSKTDDGITTCDEILYTHEQTEYVYLDLAVANIDKDEANIPEIIVSTSGGFLRIFYYEGNNNCFLPKDTEPVEISWPEDKPIYIFIPYIYEIKAVDLFPSDNYLEILGESHRYGPELAKTPPYLHVWTYDGTKGKYSHFHSQGLEREDPDPSNRYFFTFDAGDLDSNGTVEVILGTHCLYPMDEFIVWQWELDLLKFNEILLSPMFSNVHARTVTVSETDLDDDLEVTISGSVYSAPRFKDFYVEVFDWDGIGLVLQSAWRKEGTYKRVSQHTIGGYQK